MYSTMRAGKTQVPMKVDVVVARKEKVTGLLNVWSRWPGFPTKNSTVKDFSDARSKLMEGRLCTYLFGVMWQGTMLCVD